MSSLPQNYGIESDHLEYWQLNYMRGELTEPEEDLDQKIAECATAKDPRMLMGVSIELPTCKTQLQIPLGLRIRSREKSELNLELNNCRFIFGSVLEAKKYHEETVHFRVDHSVDYRKGRLEREITFRRGGEVQEYDGEFNSFMLSALGTVLLPENMQGQAIFKTLIPDEIDNVIFNYGQSLAKEFSIYGGFDTPDNN